MDSALHAPLTAIVVIFELTGNYGVILPVMLGTIVASVVSISIEPESIYTMRLRRRGVHLRDHSKASAILTMPVAEVMKDATLKVGPSVPFGEVVDRLLAAAGKPHYVVDDEGRLLGSIHLGRVKSLIGHDSPPKGTTAADAMVRETEAVRMHDDVETCLIRFSSSDLPELPVVDGEGKLVGVIRRRDILELYNRKLLDPNEWGVVFLQSEEGTEARRRIELPEGYSMDVIDVAPAFVGRTLRDLDLHNRYDVLVLGIRRETEDGSIHVVGPDVNMPLARGAELVVEGPKERIAELRSMVFAG
ncbi:MAG: CBS domain-containing protein [Polyangiales bacterium]